MTEKCVPRPSNRWGKKGQFGAATADWTARIVCRLMKARHGEPPRPDRAGLFGRSVYRRQFRALSQFARQCDQRDSTWSVGASPTPCGPC